MSPLRLFVVFAAIVAPASSFAVIDWAHIDKSFVAYPDGMIFVAPKRELEPS